MNLRKYLIVKKEKIKDKAIDVILIKENSKLFELLKLLIPKTLTAVSVGIDNKKEILAESTLL